MDIIGKPTINPFLFYSGKIAGYFTWTLLILHILGVNSINRQEFYFNDYASFGLLVTGLIISTISIFNLGKSTRFGLPTEKTVFKTRGIYKISRNPMYLGFNLITLSSIIYFLNPLIIVPGIYSIVIYHLIITGEEKFLLREFGNEYLEYMKNVRRYI